MRTLPFFKYAPAGNMTILVPELVPKHERAPIAARLMRPDHLGAEQVGYVDTSSEPPLLEMMGGELCVNACRAAAALLHAEGRLPLAAPPAGFDDPDPPDQDNGWSYGLLRSSGVPRALAVRARACGPDESFAARREAAVCLSMSVLPYVETVAEGIHLVMLPGISHLILDAAFHPVPKDWHGAAAVLRRGFELEQEEAVGCMWLKDGHPASLTPVVWVRGTNETVLETACGSGTLACAIHLLRGPGRLCVRQPGGDELEVILHEGATSVQAWISGAVECAARGEAFIE